MIAAPAPANAANSPTGPVTLKGDGATMDTCWQNLLLDRLRACRRARSRRCLAGEPAGPERHFPL